VIHTLRTGTSMSPVTVPKNPLASVLVPAFNAATTIVETLDSVRNQAHARLEIIAVDDDSIDETATSCRKQAARASHLQTDQCAAVNSS
jgi:glycosyltransferase involved in cell wall biosynthesis